MYQMILVDRTVKAVKYAHRSGSTKIDFEGTDLMAGAKGEAKVDSHRGAMEIKVEFSNMQKPTTFGGGVSDLRHVGDFARRPPRKPG